MSIFDGVVGRELEGVIDFMDTRVLSRAYSSIGAMAWPPSGALGGGIDFLLSTLVFLFIRRSSSGLLDTGSSLMTIFWSQLIRISSRALPMFCCTSCQLSLSSRKMSSVGSGVCGTFVYCFKKKMLASFRFIAKLILKKQMWILIQQMNEFSIIFFKCALRKKLVIYSNKKQLRNYARVYCIVRSYDPITWKN